MGRLANGFRQLLLTSKTIKEQNKNWSAPMVEDYRALKTDLIDVADFARQFPTWKIEAGETINVPERQQYAIHGTFVLNGNLQLETDAILVLRA